MAEMLRQGIDEELADQARFAGARHAGHAGENTQWDIDAEAVKIIPGHPPDFQMPLRRATDRRQRLSWMREITSGSRLFDLAKPTGWPTVEDAPAAFAGVRADIHQPIGMPDHLDLVLDHED
ncbi:hypothetical protein ACVWW4_007627 [Bradyrhizobium sp. LB7.1]